jgi:phospholipid transport system substrate-binding protein
MPFAPIGRRRWLGSALAVGVAGMTAWPAMADAGTVAPIHDLCDALLMIMRNGKAPFGQRADQLAPVMDRVFDLATILQVSVGPSWSTLAPQEQNTLLTAFRRYTLANYVSNFDNFNGQRFDVQPDTRNLANGEQVVRTRITSSSGETHELDYVMRNEAGRWRAVDVLADGSISRVATQRSDFRRLLSTGGAPALIESLNRKTKDLSGGALT